MRFFRRNDQAAAAIPEDLQPYYSPRSTGWQRWLTPVFRILLLLIVLALLVWGGVWLVHKFTGKNSNGAAPSPSSSQTPAKTPPPKQPEKKSTAANTPPAPAPSPNPSTSSPAPGPSPSPTPSTTPPTSAVPGPQPAPAPAPAPAATPSPAPSAGGSGGQELANTGPGETALLFIVVSLAGALIHRAVVLRRLHS